MVTHQDQLDRIMRSIQDARTALARRAWSRCTHVTLALAVLVLGAVALYHRPDSLGRQVVRSVDADRSGATAVLVAPATVPDDTLVQLALASSEGSRR